MTPAKSWMRAPYENQQNPHKGADYQADGEHANGEFHFSPAVERAGLHGRLLFLPTPQLMAEGQILQDAISIGGSKERGLPHRTTAFGAFALHQMTPACPMEQHFPGRGYFEAFCHGLPCPNAFGASHTVSLSFVARRNILGLG